MSDDDPRDDARGGRATAGKNPLAGDTFERWVREHHLAVYRTSLRITRRNEDALDVTQQVFLAVLERRLDLARAEDPARALRWWAVRTALAHLRGARNVQRKEERYAMQRNETDGVRRSDEDVEVDEARSAIERLVGALPEELRLPLELRFREELTFGAIGDTLTISEAAAHDRVRRALDRLRGELGRLGFGAFALDLERELAREPLYPPASVPADLATKLLALQKPALAVAATSAPVLAVVAALAIVLAGVAWSLTRASSGPSTAVASLATREAPPMDVTDPPRALGEDERRRMAEFGYADESKAVTRDETAPAVVVVRGRVLDEQGYPVAGARVVAGIPGKGGPEVREHGVAETGADGRYRIEVRLRTTSENLEVRVTGEGMLQAGHPVFHAHEGRELVVPPITVASTVVDPPGEFALALRVVDADGRPVSGMPVRVFRRGTTIFGTPGNEWEAGGLTDAGGVIEVAGKKLGRKLVVLDGRHLGWRFARERVDVDAPGRRELRLQVERGAVVAGTVRDVDGHPASGVQVAMHRVDDTEFDGWSDATDAAGRYRLIGVDPTALVLRAEGDAYSPGEIAVEIARAGREDLDLTLKRRDDVLDRGVHRAELHGTLVDARTREPVEAPWDAVDAVAVASRTRAEFLRDEAVGLLVAPTYQTMVSPDWREPPPASAFHATGLLAGTYVLVARVPGRAVSFAGPFELGATALVAGVAIELEAPVSVRGVVRDASGAPVANAWLATFGGDPALAVDLSALDAEIVATEGHPRDAYAYRRTDAAGRFDVAASPGIALRIGVLDARFAPIASGVLRVPCDEVVLVMAKAR